MGLFDFAKALLRATPRHPPEPAAAPAYLPPVSTDEQVLAALDTLATAPDAAAYATAWQPLFEAPADFDWQAHLTPARLDGAMRQRLWMLPGAGFTEVAATFGHLRRQLLALQRALPAAPVAPVLALHDSVFGPTPDFGDVQLGKFTYEIEWQLAEAYDTLRAWLLYPAPEAAPATAAFAKSADFEAIITALNEAGYLLNTLEDYHRAAIYTVLPQAFPHLAGHFAQRLATYPAAGQRRLLEVAYLSSDLTLRALLRELAAASPYPVIRLLASELLAAKTF